MTMDASFSSIPCFAIKWVIVCFWFVDKVSKKTLQLKLGLLRRQLGYNSTICILIKCVAASEFSKNFSFSGKPAIPLVMARS